MRNVALVSFAQTPFKRRENERTEVQMVRSVTQEAVEKSGIPKGEIGFTCSGSSDYIAGNAFAFVGAVDFALESSEAHHATAQRGRFVASGWAATVGVVGWSLVATMRVGEAPADVAVSADGTTLYVTLSDASRLAVLDSFIVS